MLLLLKGFKDIIISNARTDADDGTAKSVKSLKEEAVIMLLLTSDIIVCVPKDLSKNA